MTDKPRLIEHAFPLKQASLDSVHEKNVRHGHISTLHIWPARRPLAACRAALIATLLPDPGTPEKRKELCEKIGGRVVEKIEKKKMPNGKVVETVKEETVGGILHWGRETDLPAASRGSAAQAGNKETLDWFRQEIRKAYGGRAPKVLDPFAGGGAIPLEAMRLGCEVTAIDINPVAWFILKCTLEYPQKLAGQKRPLPEFILKDKDFMEDFFKAQGLKGALLKTQLSKLGFGEDSEVHLKGLEPEDPFLEADLAWHVRAWGKWVLNQARKDLAKYYPTYADFLPAFAPSASAQASLPANLPINRKSEFFVYVLKCSDGSFYIGQTENLDRRFTQHLEGEVSWTESRRSLTFVHWEEFTTRKEAVEREKELKTGFGRKWIQREYEKKSLRAQLYMEPRLVPLKDDGTKDIDRLNREFIDPFAVPHKWGKPIAGRPACATERSEVAGRWVAKPTVAYLWARTVKCKNCRAIIPLLKTRWLCKKDNKRVLLTMKPLPAAPNNSAAQAGNKSMTGVVFDVQSNVLAKGSNTAQRREHDKKLGEGTMSRSGAKCPCCSAIMTMEDIRLEGKAGRIAEINTAVVMDGQNGKGYRLPTAREIHTAGEAEKALADVFAKIPFGLPENPTPKGGSGASRAFSVDGYGFDQWKKLFSTRQLLALGTFVKWTRKANKELAGLGYAPDWTEAVSAYLAIQNDKVADYNSMVCMWHISRELIGHTFTRFALPITWDFVELAATNDVGGAYSAQLDWLSRYIDHALVAGSNAEKPHLKNQSAIQLGSGDYDAVVTDPPYYDAIPYSDLMDFFYLWLKRSLNGLSLELDAAFKEALSPKWNHEKNDGELIDDSSRHEGNRAKSKAVYEDGMARVFQGCGNALKPEGKMVVVFANKQPDAWETLVSALIRSGFVVDGSWPIQTEMSTRMRAKASAALASSVWLVCKKRSLSTRHGWDNKVLEEMKQNIAAQLREFWDAGIRGPDFVWAATGPAMEAYSKYPVVKKANEPGKVMEVSEFLRHVRRMVVDFVVGRVLTHDGNQGEAIAGLDDVTTYYLLHRHDFGMDDAPAGPCILYAVSCGLTDGALADQFDILQRTGGQEQQADDEETEDKGENDNDESEGSGSSLKLKPWNKRNRQSMGYDPSVDSAKAKSDAAQGYLLPDAKPEAPKRRDIPLIDQIHRLMHLWKTGELVKVDEYLETRALLKNKTFHQVLQSVIELAPAGSEERSILESISNHLKSHGITVEDAQRKLVLDADTKNIEE